MACFVLVHGLGLGGWCWVRVARRLRALGHTVFTPTLTGVGERSHLASRDTTLSTHIEDVTGVLRWEDLRDVILVGHSYGGAVVTGVADREAARIARLVYLDAFILEHAQSVMSLQPPERVAHYERLVAEQGEGWCLPHNPAAFYGVTDGRDQAWLDRLSRPHPFACLTEPVSLAGVYLGPRSYVWARDFPQGPFGQFADRVRGDPTWDYAELTGGHMLMVTNPDAVTDGLNALV